MFIQVIKIYSKFQIQDWKEAFMLDYSDVFVFSHNAHA
jgi:hypothetical protein